MLKVSIPYRNKGSYKSKTIVLKYATVVEMKLFMLTLLLISNVKIQNISRNSKSLYGYSIFSKLEWIYLHSLLLIIVINVTSR